MNFSKLIRFAWAVVIIAIVAVLALASCLPDPDCTPHTQACVANAPRTCSSTGHGYAAGGLPLVPCSAVGAVCTVTGGRAQCSPLDAGVDASEGGAP